jgi:hypothetical protein
MISELDVEGTRVSFAGSPLKFSLSPAEEVYLPPPGLGEHNEELLEPST